MLICKGLQAILAPAEIVRWIKDHEISKVVTLSSACCGLVGRSTAVPYYSALLSGMMNKFYQNITESYFSRDELNALDTIHALMHENYAWKSGHFPASKVEIFTVN